MNMNVSINRNLSIGDNVGNPEEGFYGVISNFLSRVDGVVEGVDFLGVRKTMVVRFGSQNKQWIRFRSNDDYLKNNNNTLCEIPIITENQQIRQSLESLTINEEVLGYIEVQNPYITGMLN